MQKNVVKTYIDKLQNLGILLETNLDEKTLSTQVEHISYDNRNNQDNSLFVCKGRNFREIYAVDAVNKGALAYVSKNKIEGLNNFIIVSDIRKAMLEIANLFYCNSHEKINLIGITGTKGKSTVAYMLQNILDLYFESINKNNCAFITSIETYDGTSKFESHITTPEIFELRNTINNAVDNDISHLIMEVSSQALKYDRVQDLNFEVVCFTNFGKDHISDVEHPNLSDYFESKLHIFDNAKIACVNSDMNVFDEVYERAQNKCEVITYGTKETDDIICSNIKANNSNIEFHVKTPKFESDMILGMPGTFNVSNALAAISIACSLDVPEKYIALGLKTLDIPGRMKFVKSNDNKISVVIDFAHNEMSFATVLESIKSENPNSKIISIFGCPGGKAHERRKDLPKVASKYSDYIIVCEDDPATEAFEDISNEIVQNISIENYEVIESREQALKHAIFDLCDKDAVIFFAGKGEEEAIKRGNV